MFLVLNFLLEAKGLSVRQVAEALAVPRSTLQAWRAYQESLDEHPAVVAFFHSAPGLAFLHRLDAGLHLVSTERVSYFQNLSLLAQMGR